MSVYHRFNVTYRVALSMIVLALSTLSIADTVKLEGLVKSRNGESMIVETSNAPNLVVLLNDNTEVGQVQGVLKARSKQMSMAALIPGLKVKVEGNYNPQ